MGLELFLNIFIGIGIYILCGVVILFIGEGTHTYYSDDIEIPTVIFWPVTLLFELINGFRCIKGQFKEYAKRFKNTRWF